jgi:superfamily I DNA/RNA helicase
MDAFEAVLKDAGIPATPVRKQKAYDGPLRKLMSLTRLLFGHPMYSDVAESVDLFEPGIGPKTLSAFTTWAFQNGLSASQALDAAWKIPIPAMSRCGQDRLCRAYRRCMDLSLELAGLTAAGAFFAAAERTGLAEIIRAEHRAPDFFDHLMRDAAAADLPMDALLGRLALETDTDTLGIRSESVSILTMHGAKGLEFPVVFIAGCEDGLIPMTTDTGSRQRCEEEKRLFYVAMTRARQRLVLCWSRKRRIHGRVQDRLVSPFVAKIKKHLLLFRRPPKHSPPAQRPHQLELFL